MIPFGIASTGYRLPSTTHLGAVRLQVGDLNRSLDYYQQVLGLELRQRAGADASLGAADDVQPLLHLHGGASGPIRGRAERLGLYHFALLIPSRPALGRFVAHLSETGVPLASADHGVSEALYLRDPDGLGIEVYSDRPRQQWRRQGDELLMTTEPLDLRSLLEAGGGAPWKRMPGGSVLGHVHLHVGDLVNAEAFYHRALGFDKTVWTYPGALFLSAGGYHHHLGTNTWAGNAPARRDGEPGLLAWDVVLPTADAAAAAAESCSAAGYSVERSADTWTVADPWGSRLRLKSG